MNTDLVFDVGMNNGDDTAHYLYRGFRVVAIEADPTLVDAGRERFADAIRAGQLELVNAAIGPREEIAEFWICDEKREWNSFDRSFAARDGLPHHSIPIRCRRFGDLLKQYGVPYYLKIDIEGHDQYCLDDLDPADLPQYISLELGPFETMLRLQALGYSDFKLMTQNNHTQLVIDMFRARLKRRLQPYPALYGFSRKVAALMRGSGGGDDGNINGTDPINGWQFPFGSSGPFGEETPGEWRTLDDVMFTWTAYQLGYSKYGPPQLGIWHDVHARRQPA